MSKTFLAFDGRSLTDRSFPLYELPRKEYWKRRIQFWKYYNHRTMGRPILRLRKPLTTKLKEDK